MTLVLRRKPGETVLLILPDGQRISVKVNEYAEHAVKLLFDAPAGVRIVRKELLDSNVGTYAGTYADWEGK